MASPFPINRQLITRVLVHFNRIEFVFVERNWVVPVFSSKVLQVGKAKISLVFPAEIGYQFICSKGTQQVEPAVMLKCQLYAALVQNGQAQISVFGCIGRVG